MAKSIEAPYAKALFDLGLEAGIIEQLYTQVIHAKQSFENDPQIMQVIIHPKISLDKKLIIIDSIFKAGFSREFLCFLRAMCEKGREAFIPAVFTEFIGLVMEYKGIVIAEVTSAIALDDQQLKEIKTILSTKLNKEIEINTNIDPQIVGGLLIKVDGKIFDSTIRTKMQAMKIELLSLRLA